jgi:hypothetical protein
VAYLEYRPRQTLFKYCSEQGFRGIIESKCLWFSDLASANDPRELVLGIDEFRKALERVRPDFREVSKLRSWEESLAQDHANTRLYCSSFSVKGDMLPMWSEYAAKYTGLSIGFRPTALLGIPARVQLVVYTDPTTQDRFLQVVSKLADRVSRDSSLASSIVVAAEARAVMSALKHHSWAHEEEVRLVHSQPLAPPSPDGHEIFSLTGLLPDGSPVRWTPPSVRNDSAVQVSYLQFPFGRFREGTFQPQKAIKTVIIGPKCSLSEDDVLVLMRDNGFSDFEIKRSECVVR